MSHRQNSPKHQKLLGVKVGDGFGSTSLRAPKSGTIPAKRGSIPSKGDSSSKSEESPAIQKTMLMLVNRKFDSSVTISKAGTKTDTKDDHEVISCYNTEGTKEDNTILVVDKRRIEQVAKFTDNTSESLIERKEIFSVRPAEVTSPAEEPIPAQNQNLFEAEEPMHIQSDPKTDKAVVESGIRETLSAEISETVLEIKQKNRELSSDDQKLQEKPAEKEDNLLESDKGDVSPTGDGVKAVKTNEFFEIFAHEVVVLVQPKSKSTVDTEPPMPEDKNLEPEAKTQDNFQVASVQIVVEKFYD